MGEVHIQTVVRRQLCTVTRISVRHRINQAVGKLTPYDLLQDILSLGKASTSFTLTGFGQLRSKEVGVRHTKKWVIAAVIVTSCVMHPQSTELRYQVKCTYSHDCWDKPDVNNGCQASEFR